MRSKVKILFTSFSVLLTLAGVAGGINPEKTDSMKVMSSKYYLDGNYDLASTICQDLVAYYHDNGMLSYEADQLIFLGEIHRANLNFLFALECLDKASLIAEKLQAQPLFVRIHNRRAAVYYEAGKMGEAEREIDKAIATAEERNVQAYNASNYSIQGAVLRELGEYDKAFSALRKAMKIARQHHDEDEQVTILYNLAELHSRLNNGDSTVYFSGKGVNLASRTGKTNRRMIHGYDLMARGYDLKKDSVNAQQSRISRDRIIDSIHVHSSLMRQDFIDAAMEGHNREKENIKLKNLNTQNKVALGVVILLCLLLLAGGVYIFIKNKQLSALNRILRQQQVAIKSKNHELASLNSVKDKLFSIIAHDLKNPILAVSSGLSMINSGFIRKEEQPVMMYELEKNAMQVQYLLENLLLWSNSQLKGESVNPEGFSMNAMISDNLELVKTMAVRKNIALHFTASATNLQAYADKEMIRFVLRNLLTNAIKFTNKGGGIGIQAEKSGKWLKITVADSGIGMSQEKLKNLFSSGAEISYGTDNEKGSGLGLTLCREFVEKNSGQIKVESAPEKGSRFTFTIPAALELNT